MTEPRSRVEEMVDYLRAHRDEIESTPFFKIQFDCGADVKAHITRIDQVTRSRRARLAAVD